MRKWFTAFILVAALLGGAFGVGAHEGEGSCPMSNMPDCCKKAQSANSTPEVSLARLCCNLNCSEPGSGGSNASSSFSPQPGTAPESIVMPSVAPHNATAVSSRYAGFTLSQVSSPKYIQHLALLI
ncbi:MAG TPA: hypothetical protein VKC61_22410 [Pyrinomonadaceae bacterium]|nr:hypothetical protein [Pyrinomonadaceae bacterium]